MKWNKILIKAAKEGNILEVKKTLEKGANINAKNENGWTTLMWAKKWRYGNRS